MNEHFGCLGVRRRGWKEISWEDDLRLRKRMKKEEKGKFVSMWKRLLAS